MFAPFREMAKVFLKTYGCQMNERDSEQVARQLLARGYELTPAEAEADVVLLNTCSVRDQAEQKAIGKMGMLNALHRDRPETVFGFLGCMAQSRRRGSSSRKCPRIDLVVGTQKFHRVADYVDEAVARRRARQTELPRQDDLRFAIVDVEGGKRVRRKPIREHVLRPGQPSAFVSIMQGCNMRCTFCIVPDTRGAERSRALEEIVAEVRALVASGVKEVTLLGQIVQSLRTARVLQSPPTDAGPFVQLLDAVHAVEGLERLRFTSPHPIGFRRDLVEAFARLPEVDAARPFPAPERAATGFLRAMHRPYTAARYEALIAELRAARPGIAVTTGHHRRLPRRDGGGLSANARARGPHRLR